MATTTPTSFAPIHNFHPRPSRLQSTSLSALKLAHATLIGTLIREQAEEIVGTYADPADVQDRADHLAKVLGAVADYAKAVVADTADYVPAGGINRTYIAGCLQDLISEVVGGVAHSADECVRF